MRSTYALIIGLFALSIFSGCSQLEKLRADVQKSTENVVNETQRVKDNLEKTRQDIDNKVQKVGNLYKAVKDLGEDGKPALQESPAPTTTPPAKAPAK